MEVNTIDVTSLIGSENFPVNINDVYGLIETIAVQNIRAVKSSNRIEDGLYFYDIENGSVIEEAVVEMAKGQAYDKNAFSLAPTDPVVHGIYFNNWLAKQYAHTVRRDDIRKILADKGTGFEEVVSEILAGLTNGEGYDDFVASRNLILNAPVFNYSKQLGGVPLTMKGVIYAARDMYNHVKSANKDLTVYPYVSSCPESDIRIAIPTKLLNLIDVVELAQVFNLSKEELFGKLVVVDVDDLPESANWYKVVVYDRKAMARARRLYDYTQDISGKGRFTNHYLTVDYAYIYNGLFKACVIDCTAAATAAKAGLIDPATTYTVKATLDHVTSDNSSINVTGAYNAKLTADEGYKLTANDVKVKMGGQDITSSAFTVSNGKIAIGSVTGDIVITATAVDA